ncbi:MAG: hypothetical protein WCV50_00295 [Patescibacteria group bacterium]|jgi:hypothetical protein
MDNFTNNKAIVNNFFKSKANIIFFILQIAINCATSLYIYQNIKPSEQPIYLHYNIYFGVDLIGNWYQMYILPLVGFIVILINAIITLFIYKKSKILTNLINSLTAILLLFVLLSAFLVVRQNI